MSDWFCEPHAWVFLVDDLTELDSPATVHVAWTDGTQGAVPIRPSGNHGPFAVYMTRDRLGVLPEGAWINLPSSWNGSFSLVAGPCDARDGGAVYGEPATVMGGLLSFTPVRAGAHVLRVTLRGGADAPTPRAPCAACLSPIGLEEPGEVVEPLVHPYDQYVQGLLSDPAHPGSPPPPPSMSVPASCHYCLGSVEPLAGKVSYSLGASRA
jgi:hypothetical protein